MGNYDDIIYLPHHRSKTRPQMPRHKRAAQFAPFAALTGYNAAIDEATRLTEPRRELTESALAQLDAKLHTLREQLPEAPEVAITYFQPDTKKSGGAYLQCSGIVQKIDAYARCILLQDGRSIPMQDIIEIEIRDCLTGE